MPGRAGTDDRAASPSPGGRLVAALWRHRASIAVFVVALVVYGYAWAVQPVRPQLAGVFDSPGVMFTVSETGFTAPPELAADVLLRVSEPAKG